MTINVFMIFFKHCKTARGFDVLDKYIINAIYAKLCLFKAIDEHFCLVNGKENGNKGIIFYIIVIFVSK